MKVLRAEYLGMCFGVRDAIDLALKQSRTAPLTVLGDLVHNETVLEELRARGIRIAKQVEAVQTASVMITAHGASEMALRRRGDIIRRAAGIRRHRTRRSRRWPGQSESGVKSAR